MPPTLFRIRKRCTSLLEWREAQRLSQREAAELIGVSTLTYGRLERRLRYLKGPRARRAVEVTGVPLEVIVGADLQG